MFGLQQSWQKDQYALPFSNNPYTPSRSQSTFKDFLKPSDFPSAAYCGKCHQDAHQQWRQSAHANSFRPPFYKDNVQMLIDEKGIEYTRHCEGCHNPVALFTGALTKDSKIDRSFDEDGITCSVCHSIAKIQEPTGTGSYVMGKPAVMLKPDGTPREGLPSEDELLGDIDLHKRAVMRDFYRTPEFCGACHKAAIPQELNGYKWLRAFSVYDEWQQSSWSRQTPLPFYKKDTVSTCQTCHIPRVEAKSDYAAKNGKLASHRFLGANSAIPAFYSYTEQMEAIRQFLSNSLTINFFALTRRHGDSTEEIAPLGSTPFTLAGGDEIILDLVIQNTRIGHALVPEQRDFYESWVELIATDETGRTIFHSGALDQNGLLDPEAHSYTNRLIDRNGKRLEHHEVWQTRLKTYDNTIMPGRSDLVRYRFQLPGDLRGNVKLLAKVNYRRFRKQYTDFILKKPMEFPVLELASSEFSLRVGQEKQNQNSTTEARRRGEDQNQNRNQRSTTEATKDHEGKLVPPNNTEEVQRTLLRWNNYGIALLGQQQWWKAAEAFAHTTQLNPSYPDGYTNQAIAEYSKWIEARKENPDGPGVFSVDNANAPPDKFDAALGLLGKALQISPHNARASFYKGVILRLQNRLEEAEAIQYLRDSLREYPNFRQGHQELGYVFYLKKDFARAVDEFEAVKRINPDDLTACYYLSISYARLGKPDQAQENANLYAIHRDDPNNFGLNLDFVKSHGAEGRELTPYHVHF
ncbi:MAG TPA: tetratricopeptide repeat protein [Candidatus Angelobacter sp.]|nr:tetratricopeptide repeat protein [Candidatus Angelobacter sp.]